ncbi:ribonuclease HII [Methanosalsum natronophilum]|uniref:Ribonuclease HII n=1 Tax=Methanosalsum natronophilum TaxID=768733 RepID=A0A3R7VUL9_9EURY|nr:ribonuclease HII [Methanosalsum natronophilum]MCS3923083.1 ribonuclease HII [Methanosalsum natronophilum]RQD88212.1 MAG: ribonuclease HII [Methanosalsum natronophilum]
MEQKIVGIDEAGKGPVIGPMCVAGIAVNENKINSIKNLQVRDSKVISQKKRVQFAHQIKKHIDDWYILEVSPKQIDELRQVMTMNEIMVKAFLKVLNKLKPTKAYVDSIDVNSDRFGETLARKYKESTDRHLEIVSKHKADELFPIVSAASILAKVHRDNLINDIKKKENIDFGSGYPSDPKTKVFLEDWIKNHDSFPYYVRNSWKTSKNLIVKYK